MFFLLCKTLQKPSQTPSILSITHRFLSKPTYRPFARNPNIPNPEKPTSASFDDLIATAGRSKDFPTLQLLLNKRNQEGCFNTSHTFKFVTENNQAPNTILDDLITTLSNLDPGFTRKQAFDALIIHLSKSNYIDESLRVIAAMIQGTYGVNACTFHPLLNILTRKKRFNEAWRILAVMKDNGVVVDVTAFNYLLTSYCFNGELTEAARVLTKMAEEGLVEDNRTYDAMVYGACRVGKVEGALKILRRMEEQGVSPLYSTHVHVISGLIGLGCSEQALEFVMAFGGRDKGLDTENFGFLLSCLVRKRRVEEAKVVFGEIDKRGLKIGDKLRGEYKSLLGER